MIDKQKIREKHLNLQGLSVNKGEVGKRIQKATFDAMDEFSKETAIDFAKWCSLNSWCYDDEDKDFFRLKPVEEMPAEELYECYLQSTKQ